MRPEELMIGDWILSGNEPVKVYCAPYSYGKGVNLYHVDNTYSPIPLTKEILEKNGWKLIKSFYRLNANEGYDEWLVEVTFFDEGYFRVSAEYRTDEVLQADIYDIKLRYLHQLQHLLRLIGLEKEIIL